MSSDRAAGEPLLRRTAQLAPLLEISPSAIVITDLDARVGAWNPAAEALFGYARDEAIGRNLDDLVAETEELHGMAVAYSQRAVHRHHVRTFARRTRKDGSLVDVELVAAPVVVDGATIHPGRRRKIGRRWIPHVPVLDWSHAQFSNNVPRTGGDEVKLEVAESIDRIPADVFRFVATDHVKNHPRWDPQMSLEQKTPGPIGVGTRIDRTRTRGDSQVEGEMEIFEYDPDRTMGAVIRDGPMELRSRMTVAPEAEAGSRLTFTVESDDAPLAMMEEPIKGSLRRIKEMLEGEA